MKKGKIIVILLIILVVTVIFGHLYAFSNRKIYPEDGIWYCKELQIYLNFGHNEISTAIIDGEAIDCTAGHMDNSLYITVKRLHYDPNLNNRVIFPGEYVSLNDTELVLCHRDTKVKYTFKKTEGRTGDGSKGQGTVLCLE